MSQLSHGMSKVLEIQLQDQSSQWTPRTDLLAVQGTPKSLLQHHSSKVSILWHSAFFTAQFSHPYMTTGKTIALTRQTFVGKVMSLLLNMLSRLVITFLPRSKCLLISWMQSPSVVIWEPKKIKSLTVSTVSPSICYEVMGLDAMIFTFWMLHFKPAFPLFSFTFINTLSISLPFLPLGWFHLHIWGHWYFMSWHNAKYFLHIQSSWKVCEADPSMLPML